MGSRETGPLVVGAGFMGRLHALCLRDSGTRPGGIVDVDGSRAEDLAEETGSFASVELGEAIERVRPSWAVVTSPDHLHREHAETLIRAGVPVLLEKPMALSTADAESIAVLARAKRVRVMPAHVLRFEAAFVQAQSDLGQGEIGEVAHVRASRWGRLSRGRMVRSYTSPLWHFAIHDVDLIQWLGGAPIVHVTGSVVTERGDASVFAGLGRLANGVSFELATGWTLPDTYPADHRAELDVHGSEGALNYLVKDHGYLLSGSSGSHGLRGATWPKVHGQTRGALMREQTHFVEALESGAPFAVSLDDGVAAIRGAEMLQAAVDG